MKRLFLAALALALVAGSARAQDRAAVLDSIQYASFRFFWYKANPANGLCPDRSAQGSVCSTASTGFGLSAICVGADHGWITRAQARQRVLTTLQTFWTYPQGPSTAGVIGYHGLFYHWLDMNTGLRRVDWNAELSTIDTALLFAGIMHCREYFADPADPDEASIRALADSITQRADWRWMHLGRYLETAAPGDSIGIQMGWNPTSGFSTFGKWLGTYSEAMMMYVMAIGSPTHPVPASDWSAWTSGYTWGTAYNPVGPYVRFPPLFGYQYSHCWIDFRGIQDAYMQAKGITYFENSRRAALSQLWYGRQYGQFEAYLHFGYSDTLWGWTACDGPPNSTFGAYAARGAPGGQDDGTIAPTAAISSYAFAPDSVWPCIRNFWNKRNTGFAPVWLSYGFTDSFNPEKFPWIDTDVIGIDQGPQVLMIENAINNMVWARFMQHPDIRLGLQLAGFQPVAGGVRPPDPTVATGLELSIAPNPARGGGLLRFRIPRAGRVQLRVYDLLGRQVAGLVDETRAAGEYSVRVNASGLPAGVYECRLDVANVSRTCRAVWIK